MIDTDFILVRDGDFKTTRIPITEKARAESMHVKTFTTIDWKILFRELEHLDLTVTVFDRATMTRNEQREVFLLTKDVSFLNYETAFEWMEGCSEEKVKLMAHQVWTDCSNAHRLYPDAKHTFADYWFENGPYINFHTSNKQS